MPFVQSTENQAKRRRRAASILAAAWCLPAVVLAGIISRQFDLWPESGRHFIFLGSPAFVIFVRVLFWGMLLTYFCGEQSILLALIAAISGDLLTLKITGAFFPQLPIFWFIESLAVSVCFLPAFYFARWTRHNQHLRARNIFHFLFHSALLLGVWPMLFIQLSGGNWHAWAERTSFLNKLYLQLLFIPGVFLLTAMQEFHSAGHGTPMPSDAPRRLVTTGIYSYVANPMQIGKFGVLVDWGYFWKNSWIVVLGLAGLLYSLTIARWNEDRELSTRFGTDWATYRHNVRRWLPRWRPWIAAAATQDPGNTTAQHSEAILYLDFDCAPCANLMRWFRAQNPIGLRIASRLEYPGATPFAIVFCPAIGAREERGIAAMARALEHINFAWAFFAFMLRLPLISWFAQLLTDAVSPRNSAPCPLPASPILGVQREPESLP